MEKLNMAMAGLVYRLYHKS